MMMRLKSLFLVLLMALAVPIMAQETVLGSDVDTSGITDDMVNDVARLLYCPVCESTPLDTCGTAACKDWRDEIRTMLAEGMNSEEIVDNFVLRFGDRVVGTPQDPMLRAFSLVTPWVMILIGVLIAGWTILKWKRRSEGKAKIISQSDDEDKNDLYKDMLEQDLVS
jgi:cytochrome c-type biogenesis protein CcmH